MMSMAKLDIGYNPCHFSTKKKGDNENAG